MKFRSLFVAFAATLMAPALAVAEPPAGKGSDKGPQPQVLVVRDANGVFMGELYDVNRNGDPRRAEFVFRGDVSQAGYFELFPLVVLWIGAPDGAARPGGFRFPYIIKFKDENCTGTPYVNANNFTGSLFGLHALPVEEVSGGQVLYVPVDPTGPGETVTFYSTLDGRDGPPYSCSSSSVPSQDDELAEMTEVFLNFQPPYTIGY